MWYINLSRFDRSTQCLAFVFYGWDKLIRHQKSHSHTYLFGVFICTLSSAFACIYTFVYSCSMSACGHFHAVCRSDGELFHVVCNEIRPTPCSLLSGLYLSNRLAQVISFLRRLVPARVKSELEHRVMSMRDEETGREWHENSGRGSGFQGPFDICAFLMLLYYWLLLLEMRSFSDRVHWTIFTFGEKFFSV